MSCYPEFSYLSGKSGFAFALLCYNKMDSEDAKATCLLSAGNYLADKTIVLGVER